MAKIKVHELAKELELQSKDILSFLQEKGIGVITITHDMEFVADNFQRVVAMAHKHIIADGTPRDIFSRDEIIEESKIKRTQMGIVGDELGFGKSILNAEELSETVSNALSEK